LEHITSKQQHYAQLQEEIKFQESIQVYRFQEFRKGQKMATKVISPEEYEREIAKNDPENLFFILNPSQTGKVERFNTQSWDTLKNNPAYPILLKYKDSVFKQELRVVEEPLARIQHEIELDNESPFNVPQFRLSPEQQKAVEEWTAKMLDAGLIRKSTSPFNSPIFCVRKPIGWRIVHDFRLLNARTRIPRGPIPRKDDIIDAMSNAYYFSSMDLLSGYYQLMLRESDRHLTAFSTSSGHYEYVVTAQGLAGAPSSFNRFVQQAFADLREIRRAFFDDVFIFTKTRSIEDHLTALDRVLERCAQKNITIKLEKCVFLAAEIPVLGDFVGRDGVRVDPDKIAILQNWPVPRKVSELKSFLGTIVYCSRFLKDYGKLVAPLQLLLAKKKKNDPVELSVDQLDAFEKLKLTMVCAPVLAIADSTKPCFKLIFKELSSQLLIQDGNYHVQNKGTQYVKRNYWQ
jgi:Reverse transcriptase (RNA-dependent DNA polymerase)